MPCLGSPLICPCFLDDCLSAFTQLFLENPIVNRLGLTTSDLFSVEPDQHKEEINRFLGKFRACNRSNQLLLLDTLDFLAEQLLARQNEKHKDMG